MNTTAPHYGRRIALLRGLFKLTQAQLGESAGFKQQDVSDMEGKAELSDEVLLRLLEPMGVKLERFKEMDESAMGAMIFHTRDQSVGHFGFNNTYNLNPLEELLKAKEEIKNLYERLLEAEKEKVAFLQRQLDSK
ncbi:helix-turn-helix domain-containing protein [Sinomicrobium soli]|uniref:helix-turn-helix domain-containing protein n=1 Tax=Sinomicrobium sp. N-1-3-6 TaxID=2219864 RepID=UPI0011BDCB12|nr:helix-turn-helix transcriptional regulator [Sinomicrobium sp. N-1-3-6]